MQCIRPIKAGFDRAGDITYRNSNISKELASFAFPCRKCLACRLNIAREKAIRCIHEAKTHEHNIFLTLTYNDDHVGDGRLNYLDFQLFMKRLRKHVIKNIHDKENQKLLNISFMVTGEYGDKTKRPHWHAIIFNYRPKDQKHKYTSHSNEQVFTSQELTDLWGKGNVEYGSVTMESAGYVARYSAKKLSHGKDNEHNFHPIHKTSSKHAIGKKFVEKYYKDMFSKGYIVLPNGEQAAIPRYYQDWLRKTHTQEYLNYYANIKTEQSKTAQENAQIDNDMYLINCMEATGGQALKRSQVKMTILKQKFKQLQERLKL